MPFRLNDWHRILFGNAPPAILLEILARGLVIYLLLMISMRLLGRRVAAQLTLFELSVVVTLAAAVGAPLLSPERGMLPVPVILGVVVLMQRGLGAMSLTRPQIEEAVSGHPSLIASDGRLLLREIKREGLTRNKLFIYLRTQYVEHLGQVERIYLEASGEYSLVLAVEPRPGLSVLPPFERELREAAVSVGAFVCTRCGQLATEEQSPPLRGPCPACGGHAWEPAVQLLED